VGEYSKRGELKKGWENLDAKRSEDRLDIGSLQIMQRWEEPLMQAMANEVTQKPGSILEVGFGMGISASLIIKGGATSYTVIEPHPEVLEKAKQWASRQPIDVKIIEGRWHDIAPTLKEGSYDGVFFDPFPNSEEEWTTFHLKFFPHAKRLLKMGGVFTYFAGQNNRISPDHTESLFKYFTEIRFFKVSGLKVPQDCAYWKLDYMVLASARKTDSN